MHASLRKVLICLLGLCAGTSLRVFAQVAPAMPDDSSKKSTTSSSASSPKEETIILSPFAVTTEKDIGYVATNSLAGSRLNVKLADTPASISVMTKDFLDDIGAVDISKAMEYATGAGNDIGAGGSSGNSYINGNGLTGREFNFQIRGFRANAVTATRGYFPMTIAADSFNLERIEVARGPNSLLFGIGGPGGVVNSAPKQAYLNTNILQVQGRAATWNKYRESLDANKILLKGRLAVRLNLLNQEADGYKDFEKDNQKRGALALTWQPFKTTTIRISGEAGKLDQSKPRPWSAVDVYTPWVQQGSFIVPFGTPENPGSVGDNNYSQQYNSSTTPASNNFPTLPLNPAWYLNGGFDRRTAGSPSSMFFTDGPLAGKVLGGLGTRAQGARYYRSSFGVNGAGFDSPPFLDNDSLYPRTANITGPGDYLRSKYSIPNLTIEQRVGQNLFLEGVLNRSTVTRTRATPISFAGIAYQIDATAILPTFKTDGTWNATLGSPSTTGQGVGALNFLSSVPNPYAGMESVGAYTPTYQNSSQRVDDWRLSASYNLSLGKWSKWFGVHNLLAFAGHNRTDNENRQYQETNVAANRPVPTQYFNNDNFGGRYSHVDVLSASLAGRGVPDPLTHPIPSGKMWGGNTQYDFVDGWISNSWSKSWTEIDSRAIAAQSSFFDGSLITTAGSRHDEIKIFNYRSVTASTGEVATLNPPTAAALNQSGNTYSLGAVYHVPVRHLTWLSLFVNKSTNFKDQSGAQLFEDADLLTQREIGPLRGQARDFGVKLDFLDGKINATITRFEVTQRNAAAGVQSANVINDIDAIWTTIRNGGPNTVQTDRQAADGHKVGGVDSRLQKSDGYELEVTANPTRDWRVSFNISKAENIVDGQGAQLSAYLEKHRAEWNNAAALKYDTSKAPGFLGNNTVADLVGDLDARLAQTKQGNGLSELNSRQWQANAFTAYHFSEGKLKGFTMGGGVNYRGPSLLGIIPPPTANNQALRGHAYYLLNAMAAYEFKLSHKVGVKVQFNVQNLLNNKDKQVLSSTWNTTRSVLDTYYYYFEPRNYSLTTTFNF